MPQLHETRYGQKLLEGDIPRLVKALETIATMKPSLEALSNQGAIMLTKEIPEIRTSLARIADACEQNNAVVDKMSEIPNDHLSKGEWKAKLRVIFNTIDNSTAKDLPDVMEAIYNSELK